MAERGVKIFKIISAGKRNNPVSIRILKKNLHVDHKLLLTNTQINRLNKATSDVDITLGCKATSHFYKLFQNIQNEHSAKTGGFYCY